MTISKDSIKGLIPAFLLPIVRRLKALFDRLFLPPLETLPNIPGNFASYRHYLKIPGVVRRYGGWEYKAKIYPDHLFLGGACVGSFRDALKFCQGRGIDVGAGFWPLPGAIPVDTQRGPGVEHVLEDFPESSLDFVYSSHCLEHIIDWKAALRIWGAKVKPNGILFVYLPHPDCGIWEPGSPFVGDNHKWAPSPDVIEEYFREIDFEIAAKDVGPDLMQSFFVCGKKRSPAV